MQIKLVISVCYSGRQAEHGARPPAGRILERDRRRHRVRRSRARWRGRGRCRAPARRAGCRGRRRPRAGRRAGPGRRRRRCRGSAVAVGARCNSTCARAPICRHCRGGCPASPRGPGARRGRRGRATPGLDADGAVDIDALERAAQIVDHRRDVGAHAEHAGGGGGAGAREIVIDMAAHGRGLPLHGLGQRTGAGVRLRW